MFSLGMRVKTTDNILRLQLYPHHRRDVCLDGFSPSRTKDRVSLSPKETEENPRREKAMVDAEHRSIDYPRSARFTSELILIILSVKRAEIH